MREKRASRRRRRRVRGESDSENGQGTKLNLALLGRETKSPVVMGPRGRRSTLLYQAASASTKCSQSVVSTLYHFTVTGVVR